MDLGRDLNIRSRFEEKEKHHDEEEEEGHLLFMTGVLRANMKICAEGRQCKRATRGLTVYSRKPLEAGGTLVFIGSTRTGPRRPSDPAPYRMFVLRHFASRPSISPAPDSSLALGLELERPDGAYLGAPRMQPPAAGKRILGGH